MDTQNSAQPQGGAGAAPDPAAMSDASAAERHQVLRWFVGIYLPGWIAGAANTPPLALGSIFGDLDSCLRDSRRGQAHCSRDIASMHDFLKLEDAPLCDLGHSHTTVLDRRVFANNDVSAAVEVTQSRRQAGETEARRQALHLDVAKSEHGWLVVGAQSLMTTANCLDAVWSSAERDR